MNPTEALDLLFAEIEIDMSAEGYLLAISRLRSKSPALANQVERALEPTLRKLFPRRNITWDETSRGASYRLKLLSHNPHFEEDAVTVRGALDIQGGQMYSLPSDPLYENMLPWKDGLKVPIEVAAGRELATQWIRQHRRAHKHLKPDQLSPDLSPSLICEARRCARLDLSKIEIPEWLRKEPLPDNNCTWTSDTSYPLHRAVSRLLERHRLPHHICGSVEIYILTARSEELTELNALKIDVVQTPEKRPGSIMHQPMTIVAKGVDEFTNKQEWDRVWRSVIVPLQKRLLEERGHGPQGRRAPSLSRLLEAMAVYRSSLNEESIKGVLNKLQSEGAPGGEMEVETARRLVRDLRILLKPKEDQN